MPGGVLNLISTGAENVILNSNPKKTFFKATYAKYTNFGLQKFRISCEKQPELSLINEQEFTFKIPRYADLINDTCIVVSLPNIYSPLYYTGSAYKPYEFNWVDSLGTTMIKEIEIYAGGLTLAKYSGEYIQCMSHRDLTVTKKKVFDQMIGDVAELKDPGNGAGLTNSYPHAFYDTSSSATTFNCEPSIRQRKLYIPLSSWFSESSKLSIPLIALQYQELFIKVTFRPIKEIYTILNVEGSSNRIAPNPNNTLHQLRRFLRKPIATDVGANPTIITPDTWNTDIHLITTYVFLDKPERNNFAKGNISYLVKNVVEHEYLYQTGSKKIDVYSKNCVSNYMFRFRRTDCKDTNEWNNYTNWQFENVRPQALTAAASNSYGYKVTGDIGTSPVNLKNILINLAIVINGEYRENLFNNGVYLYMEKYFHTSGNFKEGLFHYSFAINTNKNEYQPSGCMNMSKYEKITFEYNTIEPPNNPNFTSDITCDTNGDIIGIRKSSEEMNKYNYDFKVFEEKYNVLTIQGGNINLMISN